MKAFSKSIIATAIAATLSFVDANASAAPFTVVSSTLDWGSTYNSFTAEKITGNYVAMMTNNETGGFDFSLKWDADQFVTRGGSVLDTGLNARDGYGLYAMYKASGLFGHDHGIQTFDFLPGTGNLTLVLDVKRDTKIDTSPTYSTGNFRLDHTGDDLFLGVGDLLSGNGTYDPDLSTCGAKGTTCGTLDLATSFNLSRNGKLFFVAPYPFYNLSFQSGQLNAFKSGLRQVINGSMDLVFASEVPEPASSKVPEPASLALLSLGFAGLGFARRRKQA
jgi:hypothetical protein